eukprot:1379911-Rhodomonas_salina.1
MATASLVAAFHKQPPNSTQPKHRWGSGHLFEHRLAHLAHFLGDELRAAPVEEGEEGLVEGDLACLGRDRDVEAEPAAEGEGGAHAPGLALGALGGEDVELRPDELADRAVVARHRRDTERDLHVGDEDEVVAPAAVGHVLPALGAREVVVDAPGRASRSVACQLAHLGLGRDLRRRFGARGLDDAAALLVLACRVLHVVRVRPHVEVELHRHVRRRLRRERVDDLRHRFADHVSAAKSHNTFCPKLSRRGSLSGLGLLMVSALTIPTKRLMRTNSATSLNAKKIRNDPITGILGPGQQCEPRTMR